MKILINAYACSPNKGSEPGMGWNWCIHLAKHCELFIITEGEFREEIEAELENLPQAKNMHFYYNPVSDEIRKMCWNQGDWRFYRHYRNWQKKTLKIAEKIVTENNIDIIHQLNMIGFREPGFLWKINKPFVWGPIGGMFSFPIQFTQNQPIKTKLFLKLKNKINDLQIKYSPRVKSAVKKADVLLASTPDEVNKMIKYLNKVSVWESETGSLEMHNSISCKNKDTFDIIWVGRFIFSKQLEIALQTISMLSGLFNLKFHVVGEGTEEQNEYYHKLSIDLNIQKTVIWHGQIPNNEVIRLMSSSKLFFFTSVAEATSTVIMEAITCNLPIICFDTCGFGAIVDESIGVKVPVTNPKQAINDFHEQIKYLYENQTLLEEMSKNCNDKCKQFLWDKKAEKVVRLYNQTIEKNNAQNVR